MTPPGYDSFTSGEVAPARLGGGETEFDSQLDDPKQNKISDYSLLSSAVFREAGLESFVLREGEKTVHWMTNGAKFVGDCRRVEYAGPESTTAEERAGYNFAGQEDMVRIARADNAQLYCHSGTMRGSTYKSLGAHQNSLTVAKAATQRMADVWDTHQVTRFWAWGGIVAASGYELCQKARGIGAPTGFKQGQRTSEGQKPMGWIKVGDTDVFEPAPYGKPALLARVEGRLVDRGFSRWAAWLSEAVGSLSLRFAEREDIFGRQKPLESILLAHPLNTLHIASQDLAFTKTYTMADGKEIDIIGINEQWAEYGDYLRQRIKLPVAEHRAVDELFDICDRMRRSDLLEGDTGAIADRIDFVPRLDYLRQYLPLPEINSSNDRAVDRSLLWSIRRPTGPGHKYWSDLYKNSRAPDPIGQDLIKHCRTKPCPTARSAVRGAAVADSEIRQRVKRINWNHLYSRGGATLKLHPYENNVALLDTFY